MKITADTITDAQIRKLRASKEWSVMWLRELSIALGETHTVNNPQQDRVDARGRCAKVLDRSAP